MRDQLLGERRSFITETVFSHPSNVDLVRRAVAAGYRWCEPRAHLVMG